MDSPDAYQSLIEFLYRSPIGLVQISADGSVDMLNPMSAQLLMPLSSDGGLDNLYDLLASAAPQLRSLAADVCGAGVVCDDLRVPIHRAAVPATGNTDAPQLLSISLLKVDDQRLMAVLTDATIQAEREQRSVERQLDAAARTDSLTQLASRAAVRAKLQRTIDDRRGNGDEFAVLLLNCDRFKHVNETLGNAAGDAVLGLMADRLRATLRPGDAIASTQDESDAAAPASADDQAMAARIGGDEFVVLLDPLRRSEDVQVVTDRLLEVLGKPYLVGERKVHSTASIGIVLQAQAQGDADAVLRDAALAMRDAKRAGGARCAVFEVGMRERAERRGSIEDDLRRGIPAGELFVVYQPVLALVSGTASSAGAEAPGIAGVEALVRWRHPERGIVPPVEFIGIAEECGLICDIGDQVLGVACHQFAAWRAALGERAPALLAVNLSRAQLAQPGFVQSVVRRLEETGIAPHSLQLEVTESLAAQDAAVQARLHELKALGVRLALDDFGTGYSSLASLHLLPVDTVKIDRSFVSAAATNAHQRVLIEATVRVAASLGMDTVAEGIETEAQASIVARLGCDKGQGYLYSRPLPAAELLQWLDARCTALV